MIFKVGWRVKRNDTGEEATVVDVIPVGTSLFYRIEYEDGRTTVVAADILRKAVQK